MKPDDLRGTAYAPIESIEAVVQEMLVSIRERMRMNQTQAGMLEPIVRRAVHQIARKMEIQPVIYGRELTAALSAAGAVRLSKRKTAEEWISREFGPGWIIRQGMGTHSLVAMSRASFFALLDEYKAKNVGKISAEQMADLAARRENRSIAAKKWRQKKKERTSA